MLYIVDIPNLFLNDLGALGGHPDMLVVVQSNSAFLDNAYGGFDGLVGENIVVVGLIGNHLAPQAFGDHIDGLVPGACESLFDRVDRGLLGGLAQIHQIAHNPLG